jgi:hypothetical protein
MSKVAPNSIAKYVYDKKRLETKVRTIIPFLILLWATSWVAAQENAPAKELYHCPMHPDYVAAEPGTCPICGMELVRIPDKSLTPGDRQDRVSVELRPEQRRILGIEVSEVAEIQMHRTVRAIGRVSMSPPSRIEAPCDGVVGQVDKNPGATGALRIQAGEKILSIACPSGNVALTAPAPLVLLTVPPPGAQVAQGKELCTFIDLSTIYVLAEVKSGDIPFVRSGIVVNASIAAYPGKVWQGKIVEGSQQFDERSQTLIVKFQFANDQAQIWQGMLANIELESPIGQALAIPESAVVADGEKTIAFVEKSPNQFEPRPIEIGFQDHSLVEVKKGLASGERVVTTATFLLDSESRMRALVQSADRR